MRKNGETVRGEREKRCRDSGRREGSTDGEREMCEKRDKREEGDRVR